MVVIDEASAGANSFLKVRLNGSSSSIYYGSGWYYTAAGGYAASNSDTYNWIASPDDGFRFARLSSSGGSGAMGYLLLDGTNSSGKKIANWAGNAKADGGTGNAAVVAGGYFDSTSTISSVSLYSSSGNFDQGTMYVYKA